MKKFLSFCLVLILCLSMTANILAADSFSFSEGCKKKTGRGVTMYNDVDGTLYAGLTLSAGTYLKTATKSNDPVIAAHPDLTYIVCDPMNSGSLVYGYIETSAITSATKSYKLKSGETVSIPEALFQNSSALKTYIQMEYGEEADIGVVVTPVPTKSPSGDDDPAEQERRDAEWRASMAKAAQNNGAVTSTTWTDKSGNSVSVTITELGLAGSVVQTGNKTTIIPTSELTWETEAKADHVLAVINAPKQGYAALRTKSSSKAMIMDHCITNSVVRVIKYGKNWCLIDYRGLRGYVKTSSLTFYSNENAEYTTGILSYKGRTKSKNGTTTVNLRAKPVNGSRILESVIVGEPVVILSTEGKWCEVDCKGYHCYVLAEYVTVE